jgi:hypothetical protein
MTDLGDMTPVNIRQAANRELLEHLKDMVERYPHLRFGQILMAKKFLTSGLLDQEDGKMVVLDDPYFEESMVTLKRVEQTAKLD